MLVFQHYVDLPSFIRKTKSVINIKNNDEYCFCGLLFVLCGLLMQKKNCSRVSSYPHFSKLLKYDGMKFPIALKYIPKFEMMNALSVNVFTIKEEEILLLLLSKSHYTHRINLLLLGLFRN
jgi:hypothetical protein